MDDEIKDDEILEQDASAEQEGAMLDDSAERLRVVSCAAKQL